MMRQTQAAWACVLGCLLLVACGGGKSPDNEGAGKPEKKEAAPQAASDQVQLTTRAQAEQKIEVAPVEVGQTLAGYQAKGRVVLPDNATWRVGVLAEGRVERVFFNVGDFVRANQVLALMHSHDVHEARAAYANAVTERTRLQSAEALARKSMERSLRLYELKAESVAQTETARQELVNAQAATREAENNVHREEAHLREILGVQPDSNHGDEAQDLMPIKAPASGRILQKNVTPGAVLSSSTDAFVIGDLSRLWMLASVDAATLSRLRVGGAAVVTVPEMPGATYQGRITNLGQQFDPTTRLIQIRIEIARPDNRLRPEMLANAEFAMGEGERSILIPLEAIQQVNGQDVVFVQMAADRFRVQAVQLGEATQGRIRILHGVAAGQKVITKGSFIAKSELLKASIGE